MPEYSITKAAVLSLSRLMADVHAGDGIRCNAVCPGPTLCAGLARRPAGWPTRRPARSDRSREEVLRAVGAGGPLGRMAEPAEIAAVIAFLCSPRLVVRDRRGLERRRRDRARDHLTRPPPAFRDSG